MRHIFLDTETPNSSNDRVCQIGVVVEEYGDVIFEQCWNVDPETHFDRKAMSVHGISRKDIENTPTFPEVWNKVLEYLDDTTVLVMHNALFDLSVIHKTLSAYHIKMPSLRYVCTMRKSRTSRLFRSAKLNEILEGIGVAMLNHHNALCDARACHAVYRYLEETVGWSEQDLRMYSPSEKTVCFTDAGDDFYHALKEVQGILKGISSDGMVQEQEVQDIQKWIEEHECERSRLGMGSLLDMLKKSVSQSRLDMETCQELLEWCIQNEEICHENTYTLDEYHGILRGIASDGIIMRSELEFLVEWMENHDWISSSSDKLYDLCTECWLKLSEEDNALDRCSSQKLLDLIHKELKGDNYKNMDIDLRGAVFCLTGGFKSGCRTDIKNRIINAGGIWADTVTKKTRYLFVGAQGSREYRGGNHGQKIDTARKYQSQGQCIDIYEEEILMYALCLAESRAVDDQISQIILVERTDNGAPQSKNVISSGVNIDFKNAVCCLTGEFKSEHRTDIKNRIINAGGILADNVTQKTRFLFVGALGSKDYRSGSYGTKIEKALKYQSQGRCIDIYEEEILMNALKRAGV